MARSERRERRIREIEQRAELLFCQAERADNLFAARLELDLFDEALLSASERESSQRTERPHPPKIDLRRFTHQDLELSGMFGALVFVRVFERQFNMEAAVVARPQLGAGLGKALRRVDPEHTQQFCYLFDIELRRYAGLARREAQILLDLLDGRGRARRRHHDDALVWRCENALGVVGFRPGDERLFS